MLVTTGFGVVVLETPGIGMSTSMGVGAIRVVEIADGIALVAPDSNVAIAIGVAGAIGPIVGGRVHQPTWIRR